MKAALPFFAFILIASLSTAQPWLKNLPAKSRGELTFFDYQKAFEEYWAPYNVVRGFYSENGETKKAPGWKQFRRWEHDMEGKINPTTGAFPKKTAQQVYDEFRLKNPVFSSRNAGNWTSMGPNSSNGGYSGVGRLNCVAFHPTDLNTYWVGAAAGGLWMTTNNGNTWTCLTDQNGVLGVSDIVIPSDYAASNTIYIATGDRDSWDNNSIGVLKSTDRGNTWQPTGISYTLADASMVNRLLIDPNNNQVLIAATTNGAFKTTDGGATWDTQISSIEFIDMEHQPGNITKLYGATKNGRIYSSNSSGIFNAASLTEINTGRIELAVSPNKPNWVYAVLTNNENGLHGIYKSTNSGTTFTQIFSGNTLNMLTWSSVGDGTGGQGYYDLCLAVSPTDANVLLVGGINTWRSVNGGTAWSIANHWYGDGAPEVHADKHRLAFRPNGDLFECNDGGIYISSNNGFDWLDRTNGITISQMYKLGVSQLDRDEVITGLQDNGTKLIAGNNWFDVKGGDGMECLIDYTDTNIQYGTYVNGQIDRTTDHWADRIAIEPFDAGEGAWVTPYIIDPVNPSILYAGYRNVWKTTNRGDSWTQISSHSNFLLRSMAISSVNSNVIYAAEYTKIHKTISGGDLWEDITYDLPVGQGSIQYIAVKEDDPHTAWVAISGFTSPGVYELKQGETSWTNISAGLPQIPVYTVVQNKQVTGDTDLYAGTELGVYYKKGNEDWVPFNNGLPNVKVGEIEIYYASNPEETMLRAATYGRGLWETSVNYSASPMVYASSTAVQPIITSISPGQSGQVILKVEVVTSGNLSPLQATSFTFNTDGTTNPQTDITQARLYHTSGNSFHINSPFGVAIPQPNGTFTITGSQQLNGGTNHFWLTYDIAPTATSGNVVDAQCTSVTIGTDRELTISSPDGNRAIRPEYCVAGSTSEAEFISNVTMGGISRSSNPGIGGYTDHSPLIIEMRLGESTPFSVSNGAPYPSDELLVWIDWNIDGDFNDEGEVAYASGVDGTSTYTGSITPPDNAKEGITRIRFRIHDTADGPNDTPCGIATWGEVEDFTLHVLGIDPCSVMNYLAYKAKSIPGSYVSLDNNGIIISTPEFDDANSLPQDIGFTFEFQCQPFSQFILNTNGFIKLGNTPPSAAGLYFSETQTTADGIFNSDSGEDINIISPFNHDLTSGSGDTEYRVHTSGTFPDRICTIQYKNVGEWTSTPPQQYSSIEFQIRLYETSNIIEFVYGDWTPSFNGSDFKTAACGLKGTSNLDNQLLVVTKGSQQSWDDIEFSNANYTSTTTALNFGNPPLRPKPDAGRTFRFVPNYDHDISIRQIYALGEASLYYSSPQTVSAHIVNTGNSSRYNVPVTLNISGANNLTETKFLPNLRFGESAIVNFSNFTPTQIGEANIQISLPTDEDENGNMFSRTQQTTDFECTYAIDEPNTSGWGFPESEGIFYVKYHITGTAKVGAVKAYIANNTASIGQTVYAVVLNSAGQIIGQSDLHVILAGELGGWHTFLINLAPTLSDTDYYAGFAVTEGLSDYYAMGVQTENPSRPETYYYSNIDGSGLQSYDPEELGNRFMIGTILSPTPPAPGTTSSSTSVCGGTTTLITLSGHSGAIQWQQSIDGVGGWSNVPEGNGSNTAAYTTGPLETTTYYRAMVTQPGFPEVVSNVVSIGVSITPDDAGPIDGLTEVCQGQNTILYTVPPISDAISYEWTFPSGATGSGSNNNITVHYSDNAQSGNITVRGINAFCAGAPYSLPVTLHARPNTPFATFIEQPSCEIATGSLELFDLPTEGVWTLTRQPDGVVMTGTGFNTFITGLAPGAYTFTVSNGEGCISPSSDFVVINPHPQKPTTPEIHVVNNILYSDASSGNQWYDLIGPIPGADEQEYTVTFNGDFHVVVTQDGCKSDKSNVIQVLISATDSPVKNHTIIIYPNPVSEELILEIIDNTESIQFEIVNAVGQIVHQDVLTEKKEVSMTGFGSGAYMIKFTIGSTSFYRKIIKL